jgi:hypothetical protein
MENQKFTITTKQIGAILSGIALFLGGETFIGAQLIESKIQQFARPEIIRIVDHKADSILKLKKISFRSDLASKTHLSKDSVSNVLSNIIQDEFNKIYVGFFIEKQSNKIKYRHIDSEIYRPIQDKNTGRFYIVLDDGTSVWCY